MVTGGPLLKLTETPNILQYGRSSAGPAPASTRVATTTHGLDGLRRWVLRSVAEEIVHRSPVPVFVHEGKLK